LKFLNPYGLKRARLKFDERSLWPYSSYFVLFERATEAKARDAFEIFTAFSARKNAVARWWI
jgi:hypothetical protein